LDHIYYTFSLQVHGAVAALTSHGSLCHFADAKTNFLSQTGMRWIFFIQF
jgi:hypothetical protein